MDEYNNLKAQVDLNRKIREDIRKKYLDDSRNRLQTICERKVRTSFIGALSSFEMFFGFLWGQSKAATPEQELIALFIRDNNLEEEFKKMWEKARDKVLTNGNNQIRALGEEFPHYLIDWQRYKMILPVKNLPGVPKEETNV